MPFPFGPKLSFAELRSILETHFGCSLHSLIGPGELTDVNGTPAPAVHYFERQVDGESVQAVVVIFDEADYMTPTVIRSICAALKITDLGPLAPYV